MPQPDWNERYETDETPWDTGEPDVHLVEFIESGVIGQGQALDVGCGTGTNSIWLAKQGFSVVGIDLAPRAIEKAQAKAGETKADCRFKQLDFLNDKLTDGPFDFIFDRGCFHVFDEPGDRERFAERVASELAPGGRWLSLMGSTEGPERDWGPPRRSARDIVEAVEPALEILELRSVEFRANLPGPAAAWLCLFRQREVPAQPSTQRE